MSSFVFFLICIQACLIQNAFSQCLGPAGLGYGAPIALGPATAPAAALAPGLGPAIAPAAALAPGLAPYGYPGSVAASPFVLAPMTVELGGFGGFGPAIELGRYGGTGIGDVTVVGEVPVAGTTLIAGQVPILGAVRFCGDLPAAGSVTITGSCGCGCGRRPYYF